MSYSKEATEGSTHDSLLDMVRTMRKVRGEPYTLLMIFLNNFVMGQAMVDDCVTHALAHIPDDVECKPEIRRYFKSYIQQFGEGMIPIVFRMYALLNNLPASEEAIQKMAHDADVDTKALQSVSPDKIKIIMVEVMRMFELEDMVDKAQDALNKIEQARASGNRDAATQVLSQFLKDVSK